jgi:hypothetical protein
MTGRVTRMGSRMAALAVAAIGVVAIAGTALAGHETGGVKSYTGCLVSGDGVIIKVREGNAPRSACTGGQVQAHFSGGDITKISVTGALTMPGGVTSDDNGEVTIGLKPEFTLPSGCSNGEVAKWNGSGWACAADNDTTYGAGTGLVETPAGPQDLDDVFSIHPDFRVKNTPDCPSGEFATGFLSSGGIQCAAPPSSAGVVGSVAAVEDVALAGTMTVISKTLPAGIYLLFATVELENQDTDSLSLGSCSIPGFGSEGYRLDEDGEPGDTESISMTSIIDHQGGAVILACEEIDADVDVKRARLATIKVTTLG